MPDSDSDNYYIYPETYSEADSYEEYKKAEEKERKEKFQALYNKRKAFIEQQVEEYLQDPHSIFHKKCVNFKQFTCERIRFTFTPSKLTRYVSKRHVFVFTVKWKKLGNYWAAGKCLLPLDWEMKIYKPTFDSPGIRDENVMGYLTFVYDTLYAYTKQRKRWQKKREKMYRRGEEICLNRDDEEIILSEEERRELYAKREAILKRMLQPSIRSG